MTEKHLRIEKIVREIAELNAVEARKRDDISIKVGICEEVPAIVLVDHSVI